MSDSAIKQLSRKENWQLIRRLVSENASDKWMQYAVAFALLLVASAATGFIAWLIKPVINEVFANKQASMILPIAGLVMASFIVKGVCSYSSSMLLTRVGNSIVARLQRRMFGRILGQDMTFYETHQMGDIVVRFQSGTTAARDAINTLVMSIGRDFFSLISLIVVMIIQDPLISLASLCIGPPAVIGVMYLMRSVKTVARSEFVSIARLVTLVKESFLGVNVVRAYQLEPHMQKEMDGAVSAVERVSNKMARLKLLTVPLMETLGGTAVAIAIVYGGWRVVVNGGDPGSLFSFIAALLMAYEPARRLAAFNVSFQQSLIGVSIVYNILDRELPRSESNAGAELQISDGEILFKNVGFSYGDRATLSDLTFTVPAKKITALVGPSGGGKSTIFALLARLRMAQAGQITIDSQDISSVSSNSLRSCVSLVSQDSFLFEMSIRDNLRMGRLNATDAEIEEAAKAAHAHEFILEQPLGYDTQVGEGGNLLSGGQRQRIAIARALLADAPILLLDEATSALDAETEAKIQTALDLLMVGRTTIVIAHRLSTIRHAAVIHVVEEGRIVESGDHEALIAAGGLYARLCELQFGDQASQGTATELHEAHEVA